MENPNAARDPALLIAAENEVTEQCFCCLALVFRTPIPFPVYVVDGVGEERVLWTTPT
jgi:hypothetical protein